MQLSFSTYGDSQDPHEVCAVQQLRCLAGTATGQIQWPSNSWDRAIFHPVHRWFQQGLNMPHNCSACWPSRNLSSKLLQQVWFCNFAKHDGGSLKMFSQYPPYIITPWIQTILCHILQKNLRWSTKGFADEELDSDELRPLLASLKFFKAQYNHKSSMAAYCYDALRYLLSYGQFLIHILFSLMIRKYRMIFWCFQDGVFWTHPVCLHFTTHIQHLLGLGQETSEKQPPSALDFVALFSLAMKEHEESSGKKLPLVTALGNVVTEYNRGIAVKKWKVDSSKKKLIMHILRCPRGVLEILAEHYDDHKHSASGSAVLSSNVFLLPQVCSRSIKIKQIVLTLQDSTQLLIWLSALRNAVKLFHDVKLMVGKSLVIWLNDG